MKPGIWGRDPVNLGKLENSLRALRHCRLLVIVMISSLLLRRCAPLLQHHNTDFNPLCPVQLCFWCVYEQFELFLMWREHIRACTFFLRKERSWTSTSTYTFLPLYLFFYLSKQCVLFATSAYMPLLLQRYSALKSWSASVSVSLPFMHSLDLSCSLLLSPFHSVCLMCSQILFHHSR